jgi:acyl carrier protein
VQIRGHRIEVGEVQSALAAHPDVAASAVVVRRNGQSCALVGYVVAVAGARPSTVTLRRFLSERLPRYMIPPVFVLLDRLPLTRNGKLDYGMLPAPSASGSAEHTTWPRTTTERTLATMWTELLGVEPIGVHDNFFDLGGDSLLVTRLHARLPAAFGIDLPMRLVYQALDIASLAVAVDTLRSESADADLLRLVEEVETMPEEELRRRLR